MCTFCFCWKESAALVGQLINEFFRQLSSEELEVDDDDGLWFVRFTATKTPPAAAAVSY
jgi:hypothetical protein